ncbi:hypothetical protein [Brachybacterium sacelli]|uniref:hypothetical protein n=1 Tax=Brachybacterium sacelli TaxID=173364 RepID=UPI0036107FD0
MTLPGAAGAAGLLAPLLRTVPGIGSDVAREGAVEEAYERTPLRGVAQLRRQFSRTRDHLADVTVPLLLATSRTDHTVPPRDSDLVAAGVSGPVQRLSLPRSYHQGPTGSRRPAAVRGLRAVPGPARPPARREVPDDLGPRQHARSPRRRRRVRAHAGGRGNGAAPREAPREPAAPEGPESPRGPSSGRRLLVPQCRVPAGAAERGVARPRSRAAHPAAGGSDGIGGLRGAAGPRELDDDEVLYGDFEPPDPDLSRSSRPPAPCGPGPR